MGRRCGIGRDAVAEADVFTSRPPTMAISGRTGTRPTNPGMPVVVNAASRNPVTRWASRRAFGT